MKRRFMAIAELLALPIGFVCLFVAPFLLLVHALLVLGSERPALRFLRPRKGRARRDSSP